MGPLQSSINNLVGTVAAAAIGAKHEAEQKEIRMEQGELAKEQFYEAKADISRLESDKEGAAKVLEQKTADYDKAMAKRPGGLGNTKAAIAESQSKALSEKEAASRAFSELEDRIEAKRAMMSRAEMVMKRTKVIGGLE